MIRLYARIVLLTACATDAGCVTVAMTDWSRDEVSFYGSGTTFKGQSVDSIGIKVKNTIDVKDGLYEVIVPVDWSSRKIVNGSDGVLEVDPPLLLRLSAPRADAAFRTGSIFDNGISLEAARSAIGGKTESTTSALILRDDARVFRVQVMCADRVRNRWVRVGVVELGPGRQSSARVAVTLAVLPLTVVLDIITFPFMILGMAYADSQG